MKNELKRVGVISMFKIFAAAGLILGLLYGIIFFLAMILGAISTASMVGRDEAMGAGAMIIVIGLVIFVIIVIALGIIYGIMGVIGAIIYNVLAKLLGGIELELAEKT